MKHKKRIESDSLGNKKIDSKKYWGAQTQRSLENFKIGKEKMPEEIIQAFGLQKKAATQANLHLKLLDKKIGSAIIKTCNQVINLNLKDGKIGIMPKSEMIPENIVWNEMSFSESIVKSFKAPIELISIQIWFFGQIIDGKEGFDSVGGPVKITQAAGQAAQAGLPYFLEFMALISTMLGFMNILPIPALDGGHALIAIIESIFRRKIPVKVKMAIQSVAVLLLLTLMAFVLFNDIGDLIN